MTVENPMISTQEFSGSNFEVVLHPLVLLSISDYITRHTLRQQNGPVVGALLGQQHGRQVSIEHAFDCLTIEVDGQIVLNQSWFDERMQQMKDVHKSPALDIVGWYTTLPSAGPQPVHLPIHLQILQNYNESALLLGFYPNFVADGSTCGKLPLTIFESNFEAENQEKVTGDDKNTIKIDLKPSVRFKEISYTIETGDAEMIGIDSIARSGCNATAGINKETGSIVYSKEHQTEPDTNGKTEKINTEDRVLAREEEELIASLTAKMNAIKMLQARINMITAFLKEIYNSNDENDLDDQVNRSAKHIVLRSIQSLLSKLALLVPVDTAGYKEELISEQNDVNLVSLLSTITESIKDVRKVGVKHGIIESSKTVKVRSNNQWGGSSQKLSQRGVSGVGDLLT
ncbi:COP9 signalosome complex subunit 6 [Erysiphe neolycopersici]|uniref:COP9 signalosome complex subunit 6 n=1 Tax=Erysiphe neolycopersici TaxID=212602 RepID=A0A420I7M0_9PEZI|nr:COP9 signalosome complex subunit 6 [Erysiphe neolycopersici]